MELRFILRHIKTKIIVEAILQDGSLYFRNVANNKAEAELMIENVKAGL